MIRCQIKNCQENIESNIHYHHIIPKSLGGTDKDGRVALCKKHHDILHNMLPKAIFTVLDQQTKEKAKANIVRFTKWFTSNYRG